MIDLCKKVLTSNVGVNVEKKDIAHVELRSVSSAESVFTKSIFIKFHDLDLRYTFIVSPLYLSEKYILFLEIRFGKTRAMPKGPRCSWKSG